MLDQWVVVISALAPEWWARCLRQEWGTQSTGAAQPGPLMTSSLHHQILKQLQHQDSVQRSAEYRKADDTYFEGTGDILPHYADPLQAIEVGMRVTYQDQIWDRGHCVVMMITMRIMMSMMTAMTILWHVTQQSLTMTKHNQGHAQLTSTSFISNPENKIASWILWQRSPTKKKNFEI